MGYPETDAVQRGVVDTRRPRPRLMSSVARAGVATVWLAVFMGSTGVADAAEDVVITTTGDRLVGEIKRVEKDVLIFGTDYSDTDFKITWERSRRFKAIGCSWWRPSTAGECRAR